MAGRIHSELETAVKLEPDNTGCLFGLMLFYQTAPAMLGGDKRKSRKIVQQIAKIDESMGYLAAARLASDSTDKDRIGNLYLSAVKANPRNTDAILALASRYASNAPKQYDSAERYAVRTLHDLEVTINRLNSRAAAR